MKKIISLVAFLILILGFGFNSFGQTTYSVQNNTGVAHNVQFTTYDNSCNPDGNWNGWVPAYVTISVTPSGSSGGPVTFARCHPRFCSFEPDASVTSPPCSNSTSTTGHSTCLPSFTISTVKSGSNYTIVIN